MSLPVRFRPGCFWPLLRTAAAEWLKHRPSQQGAALAFYTVFSIAPVLVIALSLVGWILGPEADHSGIDEQIEDYVGNAGATVIQSMIAAARRPRTGLLATNLGWVALVFGASGMFAQMQEALNTIWNVTPDPDRSLRRLILGRLPSFLMVFVIALLALLVLVINVTLTALNHYASEAFPDFLAIAHPLEAFGSVVIVAVLFAMIFKYLPDVRIAWGDVWFGAVITALLFTLGKYAIGYYLTIAAISSAYGAAGSIAVILLWTYYSSQILFFGAEITQVYARNFGSAKLPVGNLMGIE